MSSIKAQSEFLRAPALPDDRDRRRVLILGGGEAGRRTALHLWENGYEIVLTDTASTYDFPDGMRVLNAKLTRVDGFIGAFHVRLETGSDGLSERFGYIVDARPPRVKAKFDDYGLESSDRVLSLSQVELLEPNEGPLARTREEWFHVAFLCGVEGQMNPVVFERVLPAAAKIGQQERVQTYVFMRNAQVAAPGLERFYRMVRESGTLFFKFDGPGPRFEGNGADLMMVFNDELLGAEMELIPDVVVVDEEYGPPDCEPLLATMPSAPAYRPFLIPDITRFYGTKTPKAGILAIGAPRADFDPEIIEIDALSSARALDEPSPLPATPDAPDFPVIDLAQCTFCLTCMRLCPHGAIGMHERAYVDPESCVRCGICAAECPMNAIAMQPTTGHLTLVDRVMDAVTSAAEEKRIAAFLCSRSAKKAMDAAPATARQDLIPISVPCAGTVSTEHVLAAFRAGAAAVLVAGCHEGNCGSIYGTTLARERVFSVEEMLEDAGIDPKRLLFVTLAGNTPTDFTAAVEKLRGSLGS